jgi:pilus assembly protein CpaE
LHADTILKADDWTHAERMPSAQFIVAVISPQRKIHEEIAAALTGIPEIEALWTLVEYPDPTALSEIRKATGGCVVFLDFADPIRAKAVAAALDSSYPMATAVALHTARQPHDLIELMQLGIREVLTLPIVVNDVIGAFMRVTRKLKLPNGTEDDGGGHLYAFLPSKPGVGATTLAAHSAAAAARLTNQRTLLLDFDFRLGMTSFLFKLDGNYSVLDAIRSQALLDSGVWDQMVCRRGMLDILGSAPVEFGGVNPETGAVALVDLARASYRTICVDLPGEMRDYEVETLNRAKECFLVTTSDIGALHMAKRKADTLQTLGLQNKVSVIINRAESRGAMAIRDVEAILQLPVRFSVGSSEKEIAESIRAGKPLEGRSPLAKQIETIAQRISPGAVAGTGAKLRRFIETFSVSPVRDRATWWGR